MKTRLSAPAQSFQTPADVRDRFTTADGRVLDKEVHDRISFITYIIPKFAETYKMKKPEAYLYLKKHGGIDFLFENWWALHTDNPFWAVRDMQEICYQNGGLR